MYTRDFSGLFFIGLHMLTRIAWDVKKIDPSLYYYEYGKLISARPYNGCIRAMWCCSQGFMVRLATISAIMQNNGLLSNYPMGSTYPMDMLMYNPVRN